MQTRMKNRWVAIVGFLAAVLTLSAIVWTYGFRQAVDTLAQRTAADLELASDRVTSQLQVYQELAVLMADHPEVRRLAAGEPSAQVADFLQSAADKTGAVDVFFVNTEGEAVAQDQSRPERVVRGRPFFDRVLQGALGTGYAVLSPGAQRAYFFAAPIFGTSGVQGALVVVVDVEDVEQTWRGSLPAVFFTNEEQQIFISNRPELLHYQRSADGSRLYDSHGIEQVIQQVSVGGHDLWMSSFNPYLPETALHQAVNLPGLNLVGEILVDVAPAHRLAMLQAATVMALCLAFGAVLYLVTERRRTLALANAELEGRVAQRTQELTRVNEDLRREVHERQEAEAALTRAQADLVQAGKLSALGQMSAGISHELNQPLMAIQQYAENGSAFLARNKSDRAGDNLTRIADLAARMARIIKNLRAFARNESEPVGRVDVIAVINTAVELTEPRLTADRIELDWDPASFSAPVYALGGEVRLGQVFVNLINNAADAMMEQDNRLIRIYVQAGQKLSVSVRDVGPGLKEPEKVFDPFYSTKDVSINEEGMGLGLSISYGLVQSFGGNIRGINTEQGALFTVELDYWNKEDAA
ncbi:sensor histidine kinase [Epibacterium sp. SM1979]|uniref:C4-dicarboxylate transport sensor protein DctB n=1 Tax=Tritonibacter litoralis TaxID=2662264 RepID=A0A843YD88_9RHOB|nr:ATP-binding protein [Tritonibacter litoralis]MQQ07444.1 sensor histidine kinase [Tritonibacter litoralis]